jgi:hypothetical protein
MGLQQHAADAHGLRADGAGLNVQDSVGGGAGGTEATPPLAAKLQPATAQAISDTVKATINRLFLQPRGQGNGRHSPIKVVAADEEESDYYAQRDLAAWKHASVVTTRTCVCSGVYRFPASSEALLHLAPPTFFLENVAFGHVRLPF